MVDPEGLSRLGSLIPDWPCRVKKVVHAHLGNTSRLIKLSKANLYIRELELIQPHMAQKSVLRVEVGCAWYFRDRLRSSSNCVSLHVCAL